MEIHYYKKATSFEDLMRRSLKSPDALANYQMINAYRCLVLFDDKQQKESEIQFKKLKAVLVKAIKSYLKTRISKNKKTALNPLAEETNNAIYLRQVDLIIERTFIVLIDD